jgi:hypothetical protein
MAPKDKPGEDKKPKPVSADGAAKKEKKPKDKDPEKRKPSSKDKPAGKDGVSKSSKTKGVCVETLRMPSAEFWHFAHPRSCIAAVNAWSYATFLQRQDRNGC